MANFTPVSAAIGGALIGLSAVLLMLSTGRIAGISGIFSGLLNLRVEDKGWRIAFIAGLILAPILAGLVGYGVAQPKLPSSWAVIVVAGLLVGFGTTGKDLKSNYDVKYSGDETINGQRVQKLELTPRSRFEREPERVVADVRVPEPRARLPLRLGGRQLGDEAERRRPGVASHREPRAVHQQVSQGDRPVAACDLKPRQVADQGIVE